MRQSSSNHRSGFTFVEVLASLMFMAIVIPAVVSALTISNRAAIVAERTSVAVQLGQNRLSEIIATDTWSSGESRGEFGQEWPGYRWEMQQAASDVENMTELDMDVFYPAQGQERSIRLSTLVSSSLSQQQ